jgi:hypothetical protein
VGTQVVKSGGPFYEIRDRDRVRAPGGFDVTRPIHLLGARAVGIGARGAVANELPKHLADRLPPMPTNPYQPPNERRRKWLLRLLFSIALIGVVWAGIYVSRMPPAIKCPPGVREFRSVHKVPVTVEKIGAVAGYQSLTLVSLKSGDVVAPVLLAKRPRKNGRVYLENCWVSGIWVVGSRQAFLELPKDDAIDKFLILLRLIRHPGESPEGPWRVWEVKASTVFGEDVSLALPSLDELPLFDDRSDADELSNRAQAASRCADATQQ